MAAGLYIGRRLSFDGCLCTVRYIGALDGVKGEWLGVEWDDAARGKHDGSHKGKQVFTCLSSSSTAASFVKSSRKADPERTVLEAIKHKYGSDTDDSLHADVVVISGKVAEEVGFDKIAKEQAELAGLRIVLIDQLIVSGITARGATSSSLVAAQQELSSTCPNIIELDIGWNTIEDWQDVVNVCQALTKLRTLWAGGLRLRNFEISSSPSALAQLRVLHLDECFLSPGQLSLLLHESSGFPGLEELHLSGNQLTTLLESESHHQPQIKYLKSLVLENNLFENLECITEAAKLFPNLESISLQANQISSIGMTLTKSQQRFQQIVALNLSSNKIDSYTFLDELPACFPNLSSLRVTSNPLFAQTTATNDPRASDKSYYLSLARIPTLKTLNYATITPRDRDEGEIYYLSVAEKEFQALFRIGKDRGSLAKEARKLYPRYETLCEKHSRDSIVQQLLEPRDDKDGQRRHLMETAESTYPAGSLGARLVQATFYIPGKEVSDPPLANAICQLPSSLASTRLMSLLLQHSSFEGHLRPLQFKLWYESKELDPVDTTAESTTRSAVYGKDLTFEQKRAIWQEWGDWDADAIVEEALRKQESSSNDSPGTPVPKEKEEHWTEDGKFLVREGRRWKRREVEIPQALKRPWGDWIDDAKEVTIRIEPFILGK